MHAGENAQEFYAEGYATFHSNRPGGRAMLAASRPQSTTTCGRMPHRASLPSGVEARRYAGGGNARGSGS